MPFSASSPCCNYCGAALKEGGLDWEGLQAKNRADQLEATQRALKTSVPPMTKTQRTMAVRNLDCAPPQSLAPMLHCIVDGLMNDYTLSKAETTRTCSCGRLVNRIVQVNWDFDMLLETELEFEPAYLALGKIRWNTKEKRAQSEFLTIHATCSACVEKDFGSRRAYEQAVEPMPPIFSYRGSQIFEHTPPSVEAGPVDAASVTPVEEAPSPLYLVMIGSQEKGPFSISQIRELYGKSRINFFDTVRLEGDSTSITVGQLLQSP